MQKEILVGVVVAVVASLASGVLIPVLQMKQSPFAPSSLRVSAATSPDLKSTPRVARPTVTTFTASTVDPAPSQTSVATPTATATVLSTVPLTATPTPTLLAEIVGTDSTPTASELDSVAALAATPTVIATPLTLVSSPTPSVTPTVARATTPAATTAVGIVKGPPFVIVNVRADPSRRVSPVGQLRPNERVDLLGTVRGETVDPGESRWWHVRVGTLEGYVYYSLIAS